MPKTSAGRLMRKEIIEQPAAVTATLAAETDKIRQLAEQLRKNGVGHVLLVARGTSDNAAMYARYAFSVISHKITTMMATSLMTVYDVPFDFSNTLVLGISQSGQSAGVIDFVQSAKRQGALTCALTNTPDAPISRITDYSLCTHAREESSVPATKTYTTALSVLHQLATLWAGDPKRAKAIYDVPKWQQAVLAVEDEIKDHAERYRYMENCAVMGRGLSFCSALETALKLAQCCHVVPSPYSGVDFLHGPIASIEEGFPCFLFAPEGYALQSMSELVDALERRGAETVVISNNAAMLDRATIGLRMPQMPEEFAPMVEVVAGQLLALHLARHKRLNPDEPPGISKVTLTL